MSPRRKSPKSVFWQGNQAVAEGALAAGCSFFAGYPITPSSEVLEIMARKLPLTGGAFIQMEDEISSMAAIVGASLSGAKSMTATSGPGFSLMQENLGFACMAEVPCVLLNVMRGGFSTGMPTAPGQGDVMQSRWGTHGDHPIIVLAASSVEDCFFQTVRAFNLAERFRTPVIILSDETVGHTREKIELPTTKKVEVLNRQTPEVPPDWFVPYKDDGTGVPPMASFGSGYRYHVTGLVHDERGYPTTRTDEIEPFYKRLFGKINRNLDFIVDYDEIRCEDADLVVVAYGSVARSAELAVTRAREAGLRLGLFKVKTLTPFPYQALANMAARVEGFLIPELNLGQVALDVAFAGQGLTRIRTINRIDGHHIEPDDIVAKAREMLGNAR